MLQYTIVQCIIFLPMTVPVPTINIIPPPHGIFVGSSPNFTCAVEFNDSVDIPLDVGFSTSTTLNNDPVLIDNYTHYSKNFTIDSVEDTDSGRTYFCQVSATGSPHNTYILPQKEPAGGQHTLHICK